MRSRAIVAIPVALALGACAEAHVGPAAPIAPAQVTPGPALEASAARQTVVDFIEAYRASAEQGIGPLVALVAGQDLASWVRWLGVQHREFDGEINAMADVRDVEFVGAVTTRRVSGASVGLSASVTFTFQPVNDDPIELVRVLDGPVTLVRTAPGTYRVLDLLRNGVPMSDGIQPFRNERRTRDGVTVRLDSLFMFPPNWQFNVEVENDSASDIELNASGAALFVEQGDAFERLDAVVTGSLMTVPAGITVDGILALPAQSSAQGRVLSIVYGAGARTRRFEFPIEDLVTVVPPPPPTDRGAPESSPS